MVPVRSLPEGFNISSGGHSTFERGACLLELTAYLAGEEHTDSPECVSPVLSAFGRNLNDSPLFSGHLDLLQPFASRLIGTVDPDREWKRAFLLADWAVRCVLAKVAEYRENIALAEMFRSLGPIVDYASAVTAKHIVTATHLVGGLDTIQWERCWPYAVFALENVVFARYGDTGANAANVLHYSDLPYQTGRGLALAIFEELIALTEVPHV